jgi:4-nitrophenyl phosphatase
MSYEGIIFDVDGTVVREDVAIAGAAEGLAAVEAADLNRVFISNNPTKVPAAYEKRFERAGFDVDAEEVFTAGTITTEYLTTEHSNDQLFVIADPGVDEQLLAAGLQLTDDPAVADALVASMDREFGYQTLCDAIIALDEPIPFIGTDPDMLIPQAGPNIPGSGAMINAIEGVTNRTVDLICGKPSPFARQTVLDYLDLPAEDCVVVGDRLDTDIKLGTEAGMTTVLVRTGVTDDETLAESPITPDYVLDSLAGLESIL